jgi:hypothetical protein
LSIQVALSALVALAFAGIHVLGPSMKFLRSTPRSAWLSLAGGVSVAYVFVHVLPELAEYQKTFSAQLGGREGPLGTLETHSYLIALIGLATFYGLDRFARSSAQHQKQIGSERRTSLGVFWIHLGSYAVYSVLIGYLLLHREETDLRGLAIYAVAMGLHFVVNDQGLREQHGLVYDRIGRWVLVVTPLLGWGLGLATELPPLATSSLFAFLAGGVVLNVLKEELPEDRESRFWAFALGTAAYTVLLIVSR